MVKSERNQFQEEDAQRIRNCLTDLRARMYRQALLQRVTITLFCGLILLVILFFSNRLIPLPIRMSHISWIVLSVSVIVGIGISIKHWKDLSFVAQFVDEKMEAPRTTWDSIWFDTAPAGRCVRATPNSRCR